MADVGFGSCNPSSAVKALCRCPLLILAIDNALIRDALQATGARSKREVVELGLRTLIQLKQQEALRAYRGKLPWEGDLETLRRLR